MIAGTHSGSGKTTLTLGLMAALQSRGLKVAPFKVGPDFIDPGHHTQVTGTVSRNLDGWMLSKEYNLNNFSQSAAGADIAVIEGVMGLYDGYEGKTEAGSTAQMAKWLDVPVLLVVNARSMARSAAAIVQGFESFDPELRFAGVVFNRIGSSRHLAYLTDALAGNVTMPCLGGVMRTEEIAMPERHLGLVTTEDHRLSEEFLAQLSDLIEQSVDLDRLLEVLPTLSPAKSFEMFSASHEAEVGIAVARDSAFCFYYPENLDLLRQCGARIAFFSPLKDSALPPDIHGIYFGGGYPELHCRQLTDNKGLRREIRALSQKGMPIYGECGGLMYLGDAIWDLDKERFPMTGCLPVATRMLTRLKRLGYREITLTGDTLLGASGSVIRGHEFHYSEISESTGPMTMQYAVKDRAGRRSTGEGYQVGRTLGSYIHLHWGSCPEAVRAFVSACRTYKKERNVTP